MISERLLRKWRKEILKIEYNPIPEVIKGADSVQKTIDILGERILKLTQELLDQHLLNKK